MTEHGDNGGPKVIYGNKGWVAIHRSLRSHWIVGFGQPVKPMDPERGAFSRNEAFIDLIMECRYEAGFVNNGGRKMELKPGQLIGAVSWLAARWNWTPKTVRGFLDKLEEDGTISMSQPGLENGTQKGKQSTIITLCNYEHYQLASTEEGQANGHAKGTQRASKGQAKGNNTKDNKGTKEQGNKEDSPQPPASGGDPIDEAFAIWWDAYPECVRKVARSECGLLFRKIVTGSRRPGSRRGQKALDHGTATPQQLIDAARAYAATKPNPEYVPAPMTWLNQGRWTDEHSKHVPTPAPVEGKSWGWWRGKEAKFRNTPLDRWRAAFASQRPNGTWPWWLFGPPPGHPECLVPRELIEEHNWEQVYRGSITHD